MDLKTKKIKEKKIAIINKSSIGEKYFRRLDSYSSNVKSASGSNRETTIVVSEEHTSIVSGAAYFKTRFTLIHRRRECGWSMMPFNAPIVPLSKVTRVDRETR